MVADMVAEIFEIFLMCILVVEQVDKVTDEVGMMVDEQVDWGASWVINEVDNVVQEQGQSW